MTDSRARRRLGRVAGAFGVLLLVVVLARSTDGAAVSDVLPIPRPGQVVAEVLDNGTPVFVVHAQARGGGEATIDVVQAFTTEVEGPITGLVGWCAGSQQFTQPHLGPLYDVRGRRLPTSTLGRLPTTDLFADHTALDDLLHRTVVSIEDREQVGDPLVVEGIQPLQGFQVAERPVLSPTVPPGRCRLPGVVGDTAVDQQIAPGADADGEGLRLLDHGFLAGRVEPDAVGWQITDGWVVVQRDGAASWCDARPVLERAGGGWAARCAEPRSDVRIGFPLRAEDLGGVPLVIGGPVAARLRDGVVQRIAVLPQSTWQGSSLGGTEVLSGTLAGYVGAARVLLLADPVGAPACRGRYSSGPAGGPARVRVEPGVPVTVQYTGVEVVVDAVTCRALRVDPQR